jgi:hypothetical protein
MGIHTGADVIITGAPLASYDVIEAQMYKTRAKATTNGLSTYYAK